MKKNLMLMTIMIIIGFSVQAQQQNVQKEKKFSLSFSAGPSFPVAAFGSKDTSNEQAGFAKTGVNANLGFGYHYNQYLGLASSVFYTYHSMDISGFKDLGVSTDHWQYYGIVAGPMISFPLAEKMRTDLKLMGGIVNANSPSITMTDGTAYFKEDWSTSFVLQLNAGLTYNITKSFFLGLNLDYNYTEPKFEVKTSSEMYYVPHALKQKISDINLSVGVGVNF